jgi:hypothetical protein
VYLTDELTSTEPFDFTSFRSGYTLAKSQVERGLGDLDGIYKEGSSQVHTQVRQPTPLLWIPVRL